LKAIKKLEICILQNYKYQDDEKGRLLEIIFFSGASFTKQLNGKSQSHNLILKNVKEL
jgi:hypothetical protein